MIYVFKTSVSNKKKVRQLKPQLDKICSDANWNFDLDDCDKILRIDSPKQIAETVIKLLKNNGYECVELTD